MFDAHCHLTDDAFAADADETLDRARAAGVNGFVTIGANVEHADAARGLADRHGDVCWTAGIHPHEASSAGRDFGRIAECVGLPRMVALGETGLDYHYDNSPRQEQREAFERHLATAADRDLPVVVHTRDAEIDTGAMMRAAGDAIVGVLHCFTGTSLLLDVALDLDWYVSFAGIVTFRKYEGRDLVRQVPEDRILIETDSPYLAPVPHRGRRNEPSYLPATCAAIAAMRGVDVDGFARTIERNARTFYRIS
jgi:TatD DNase family protein